jgi:predicted nucleic acid-binding Zn ribbon protein
MMPIYTYECQDCGFPTECREIYGKETVKFMQCKNCSEDYPKGKTYSKFKRVISKSSFILRGEGWAKDMYNKCKKEKE